MLAATKIIVVTVPGTLAFTSCWKEQLGAANRETGVRPLISIKPTFANGKAYTRESESDAAQNELNKWYLQPSAHTPMQH